MTDTGLVKFRGRFLVLDGPDGAGKSTQIALLAQRLGAAVEVVTVRDPGGTAVGDRIRAILLDNAHHDMAVSCELMLYMASRAQLVARVIRPALARGACVVSDRYVSSTLAYQGAGGTDLSAIRQVADVAVGGLWPDATVILDLSAEAGLARAGRRAVEGRTGALDRMEQKGLDFHRRVRNLFLQQAREQPARMAVVDATQPPQDVHKAVWTAVMAMMVR